MSTISKEEKAVAQQCVDIIQQQAHILNKIGADVSDLMDETRDINRWLVIEGAEGPEIFDIEPTLKPISIHSGAAQ